MPRDLADVLHYFLPEILPEIESDPPSAKASELLPILGVPTGDCDVVRTALAWNLAVETARLGATAIVLAPATEPGSPLWPEPGIGPLGTELQLCSARTLADLYRAAEDLARSRSADARRHGGIVFVRIPTPWLEAAIEEDGPVTRAQPFRWLLLLTSSPMRELKEAAGLAEALLQASPRVEIGITIHGVQSIEEAKKAFDQLHDAIDRKLEISLRSYGLLVDDLDVYRAIAAQRPIGLAHPQAPATRALMDVARLLYADARSRVLD